jgi:L-rhamnose mutarotase
MMNDSSRDLFSRYIYRLKIGAGDEYDRRHLIVWPEMLDLIRAVGITDYVIWRHKEIVVCQLLMPNGYQETKAILDASDIQRRWTASFSDIFESVADPQGEPFWLEEVFRFDS